MNKITAPKGTKDIFSPEIEKWHFFENEVRKYFSQYLFKEIRTPVFEKSELFSRSIGSDTDVVQKEMYTFEDKAGRSMTLRPENTASVVRALIENNLFTEYFPLRFFYIGPMFRYDKPQKGRYRQFHQFGVEIFGDNSSFTDAEVIFSSFDFLKKLNISNISLHLNSVGCTECRPGYMDNIKIKAEKNRMDFCEDCQRKIDTNPLRIFDCKIEKCIDLSRSLPKITDFLCNDCDIHYTGVKENLRKLNIDFFENSKLVRGLDYYTKTAFEIVSANLGAQNAILGGGRYNNLVKELGGPAVSGIGFSGGIERILLSMDELKKEKDTVIFIAYQGEKEMEEAFKFSNSLRKEGYTVYMDYTSKKIKKQFQKGEKAGADFTFIIGEDELKSGTVSIKTMATREQVNINRSELEKWMKVHC